MEEQNQIKTDVLAGVLDESGALSKAEVMRRWEARMDARRRLEELAEAEERQHIVESRTRLAREVQFRESR